MLAVVAFIAVAWLAARARDIQFSELSRDPAEILGSSFYLGSLTHVGVLVWWSSAAICFFAAGFHDPRSGVGNRRAFLRASAVVAAWLTLDDFFLLHDVVFPRHLGIRQRFVLLIYGAGMVLYLARFRKEILKTEYLLFAASLACFGVSVLADVMQSRVQLDEHHLIEDGSKFLGIAIWTLYFVRAARPPGVGEGVAVGVRS